MKNSLFYETDSFGTIKVAPRACPLETIVALYNF
jgi:hypothetical protein